MIRRSLWSSLLRQALTAMRCSHVRSELRPSNPARPRSARRLTSCSTSSASWCEPSMEERYHRSQVLGADLLARYSRRYPASTNSPQVTVSKPLRSSRMTGA